MPSSEYPINLINEPLTGNYTIIQPYIIKCFNIVTLKSTVFVAHILSVQNTQAQNKIFLKVDVSFCTIQVPVLECHVQIGVHVSQQIMGYHTHVPAKLLILEITANIRVSSANCF